MEGRPADVNPNSQDVQVLSEIHRTEFYIIERLLKSTSNSSEFCFRKKYLKPEAKAEKEIQFLKLLLQLDLEGAQTIHFIKNKWSSDRRYQCCYFDNFDYVLSSKIGQAKLILGEMDYWHHFYTLSQTLFILHGRNLYHRNLTSRALFVRGEELYIGNFENAIELPNDVLEMTATEPPNEHCPKVSDYKYKWVMKEDAWALGEVLFDMIRKPDTSENPSFSFPSEEYVRVNLQTRYSHYLTEAILILLQVDHERRPSPQDFFRFILPKFYHETACLQCGVQVRKVWPCPHILCDICHFQAMKSSNRVVHCECSVVVDEALARLLPKRSQLLACGIMGLTQNCLSQTCQVQHSFTTKQKDGVSMMPQYIRCRCGASYCPYCSICNLPGDHIDFGVPRECIPFKKAS